MVSLVTLEQIKQALIITFDDDDDFLELLILTASASVLAYLKLDADDLDQDSNELVVDESLPEQAKVATTLLVGYLYRNRDRNEEGDFEQGFLPKPVTALLYPLRDPTLA